MADIDLLVKWAGDNGIQLDGIQPAHIPNRGVGLRASRKLKEGDIIVTVPMTVVRSIDAVPQHISRKLHPKASIHATLALQLAADEKMLPACWSQLLPTYSHFEATMPITWPAELQALLPQHAKGVLKKQNALFNKDWEICTKAFPDLCREDYLHAWLLINTRAFYYESPTTESIPWEDRLALLPVADLLNHADRGCKVSFSPDGYTISSDRTYSIGEEISICYGEYCNDALFSEYGFYPEINGWDKICLNDLILPKLKPTRSFDLGSDGFSDEHIVRGVAMCHKAQDATHLLCGLQGEWDNPLKGWNKEDHSEQSAESSIRRVLAEFSMKINQTKDQIEQLEVGAQAQKTMLIGRWEQISVLLSQFIKI